MAENKVDFSDYKGPSGVGRDSVWLTNEDLPHDRDTPVTIERTVVARKVKFQQGREVAVVLALKFAGKDRVLRVNATIRRVLVALYGADTSGWWGKPVLLYVEQDVRRPDGSTGPAVRIRAKRPDAPKPAATGATKAAPSPARQPGDDVDPFQ